MAKMIPMIGSSEAGPLGAMHLPRLWLKVSLSAAGQLNDEYDACGAGFDQMVLDGLGVDRDAAVDFITSSRPTYPQFEQWVVDQNGGSIDQSVIDASNAAIAGYNHADDIGCGYLGGGWDTNADGAITDAVTLNALEDWSGAATASLSGLAVRQATKHEARAGFNGSSVRRMIYQGDYRWRPWRRKNRFRRRRSDGREHGPSPERRGIYGIGRLRCAHRDLAASLAGELGCEAPDSL